MRLLMLDHESGERKAWIAALKLNGFGLDLFETLAEGMEAMQTTAYETLLVNGKLPHAIRWMRDRRAVDSRTPFVVVTPPGDVDLRIEALEYGADDCIADTLDARELIAKLRALLRRQPIVRSSILKAGNLELDVTSREARVDGRSLSIPRRELSILEHFIISFNRVLSRDYFESTLYGASSEVCPNSLEVRISRLRRILNASGADVEIKTVRGIGYRMEPSVAKSQSLDAGELPESWESGAGPNVRGVGAAAASEPPHLSVQFGG
jgi:two-component system response regulator QseB